MLSREEVIWAYRLLLERDPESDVVIAEKQQCASLHDLVSEFLQSQEFRGRNGIESSQPSPSGAKEMAIEAINARRRTYDNNDSRFWSISSTIDCVETVLNHVVWNREPIPGHIVNFLNVAMNVDFMPSLKLAPGSLDVIPIPANYHADLAEWAAMLRAVDLARDTFTSIELGCGWGACLNNTGAAAKRKGLKVTLIGVEGDAKHIGYATRALETNGFLSSEYVLHRGIAAADKGFAFFPKQEEGSDHWGLEAQFVQDDARRQELAQSGKYEELPMMALADVIGDRDRIDLLHIDIQGAERELVHDAMDVMSRKVAYVFVGTHSREIEGEVMAGFLNAGWQLEIERPLVFDIVQGRPITRIDGVQAWRNPNFLP
jgi:hypothetical protein